jgi:hypothetical protein
VEKAIFEKENLSLRNSRPLAAMLFFLYSEVLIVQKEPFPNPLSRSTFTSHKIR